MPQVRIIRSACEMGVLRPLWESFLREGKYTIFQDFLWNLRALDAFAGRERPAVISVEATYGASIIPAVLRYKDSTLGLVGEELFDYRSLMHRGEPEVFNLAIAELAGMNLPLQFVAAPERDYSRVFDGMMLERFVGAPAVHRRDIAPEEFEAAHRRLARNLRRLNRLGYDLKAYDGRQSQLLRSIYERKAAQDPASLFHDRLRIDFLVELARCDPAKFELFTLESASHLAAALVVLRDRCMRRFYTGWFDAGLEKHSPAMVLIFEVTRRSLENGLDCDYMTGEQPYKMRLATRSEPLYRVSATPQQLSALSRIDQPLSA